MIQRLKAFVRRLLVALICCGVLYFFLPTYLQNSLLHLLPGIYDYQFFENNEVRNNGELVPWETDSLYNTDSLKTKYASYFRQMETVGFLVIQKGKILHESYFMGSDEAKLSGSFSAAKSIVAMLIGCAIDDGYIASVNDPVGKYLETYNQGDLSVVTIRDLLHMSSGLSWDESYSNPFSVTTQAYYGDDLWPLVSNLKLVRPSGEEFKYLSGDTQLLGFVVKAATGKSLASYCSEKIWSKVGASQSAYWSADREGGMEKAYCCFNASLRDFARFGKLLLHNGQFDSTQVISTAYMKEMQKPANHLKNPSTGKPVDFYGYQMWHLEHNGYKIPYMRGIGGQYIFSIPSKDAIVVRLGHRRSETKVGMHRADAFRYLDMALEILE